MVGRCVDWGQARPVTLSCPTMLKIGLTPESHDRRLIFCLGELVDDEFIHKNNVIVLDVVLFCLFWLCLHG